MRSPAARFSALLSTIAHVFSAPATSTTLSRTRSPNVSAYGFSFSRLKPPFEVRVVTRSGVIDSRNLARNGSGMRKAASTCPRVEGGRFSDSNTTATNAAKNTLNPSPALPPSWCARLLWISSSAAGPLEPAPASFETNSRMRSGVAAVGAASFAGLGGAAFAGGVGREELRGIASAARTSAALVLKFDVILSMVRRSSSAILTSAALEN
mmetsp:Transcript_40525/g.95434  ORF Transcript_40525/g.95434 Transcript_40525/m.95434 type:complete len:210 (+) Transcript_40525:751-1380(+)